MRRGRGEKMSSREALIQNKEMQIIAQQLRLMDHRIEQTPYIQERRYVDPNTRVEVVQNPLVTTGYSQDRRYVDPNTRVEVVNTPVVQTSYSQSNRYADPTKVQVVNPAVDTSYVSEKRYDAPRTEVVVNNPNLDTSYVEEKKVDVSNRSNIVYSPPVQSHQVLERRYDSPTSKNHVMQSNYEEAKTYSSPHKNKDWASCCLLLLALLALGLIVATAFYAWGWGDDRRNVNFGRRQSLLGPNSVHHYSNGTTFYDRRWAGGNREGVTGQLIQQDNMPINTTVLDRFSKATPTLNPNPRYQTTTNYTDGSTVNVDKEGTRVSFNKSENTTRTTFLGGPIITNNNIDLINTTNLAGQPIRTDKKYFNLTTGQIKTQTIIYNPPSIVSKNISTVNTPASDANGNITTIEVRDQLSLVNGSSLINRTTSYPNGTVIVHDSSDQIYSTTSKEYFSNGTISTISTLNFPQNGSNIVTTTFANGTVMVDNSIDSSRIVTYPNRTEVKTVNNQHVYTKNVTHQGNVSTTTITNNTLDKTITYHTVPSANGKLDKTFTNNFNFPTFQSGPFNYQPNPFNQAGPNPQYGTFTPDYYSNYVSNQTHGGLSHYVNFNNPLDPHELYFDQMRTEAIYLWASCAAIFLLILALLLAYCCGCLSPRTKHFIITLIIIIWFAMAIVLLLRFVKNRDLQCSPMPWYRELGYPTSNWRDNISDFDMYYKLVLASWIVLFILLFALFYIWCKTLDQVKNDEVMHPVLVELPQASAR